MQTQRQSQGLNFWKPAAIGSVFLALTQVYEPIKDIYSVYFVDGAKGVESLRIGEWQNKLAIKNQSCVVEMRRTKVKVNEALDMAYGACPNNNVLVVVYPKGRSAYQLWMEPNEEQAGKAQASSIISSAFAAMAGAPAVAGHEANPYAPTRVQMVLKTLCQNWNNTQRTKLDRITDEGGQCYYERVNTLSGIVEVRETVPCDMKCDAAGKQFSAVKR
jgi:hypothetical protein